MRRPALLALLIHAGCPSSQVFDPMEAQPKYRPYSENEFFSDHRAMRVPPANTVPREHFVAPQRVLRGRVVPDGPFVERVPFAVTKELLLEGKKQFQIVCATCHGILGDGHSAVAANMSLRPPPSLHDYADRPPGFFYEVIYAGFGMMPSLAERLSVTERWAVVAYIRALILSQGTRIETVPPDVRATLTGGGG